MSAPLPEVACAARGCTAPACLGEGVTLEALREGRRDGRWWCAAHYPGFAQEAPGESGDKPAVDLAWPAARQGRLL